MWLLVKVHHSVELGALSEIEVKRSIKVMLIEVDFFLLALNKIAKDYKFTGLLGSVQTDRMVED